MWLDLTGSDVPYAELTASPSMTTLPASDDEQERARIAEQERKRKARGIGFAPARTPPEPRDPTKPTRWGAGA